MTIPGSVEVGTVLPPLSVHFTRATLVRYAGASTDFNPIHWSDRAASDLGLPSVIAHGMLTMGTGLRVVTEWAGGADRIASYYVRFTKPVPVPDDDTGALVEFSGTVTKIEDGIATVALQATCGEAKVLGSASVEVLVA